MESLELHKLCRLIQLNGIDNAGVRAAVLRLERVFGSCNEGTCRFYPQNASNRSQTAKVVSLCLRALTQKYQAAFSPVNNSVNSTEQLLERFRTHLAGTYQAVAECWDDLVGNQEVDKLAVATSLSTAGVLEDLSLICEEAAAKLFTALTSPHPTSNTSDTSSDIMLASGLVEMWHSFVTSWPSSRHVLVGKDLALLAQPVARLVLLLLHSVNRSMQQLQAATQACERQAMGAYIPIEDDGDIHVTFQPAFNACLKFAEHVCREIHAPADSAAASTQQGAVVLQNILDTAEVPAVFAVGAACYILGLQELELLGSACQDVMQQNPNLSSPNGLKDRAASAAKSLQTALQLDMLDGALTVYVSTALQTQQLMSGLSRQTTLKTILELTKTITLKNPMIMIHHSANDKEVVIPTETHQKLHRDPMMQKAVNSIIHTITQIARSISQPSSSQQQEQHEQNLRWLTIIAALSRFLQGYVCSVAGATTSSSQAAGTDSETAEATEQTCWLAIDAMVALLNGQLSTITDAVAAAMPYSISSGDIINSMSALEGCFRSAAAMSDCGTKLLGKALSACSIIAAHNQQLLGRTAAIDKSVRSLLLTSLKLAEFYINLQPDSAATLAQVVLTISTAELITSKDNGTNACAAQDQPATNTAAKHCNVAHEILSFMAGHCLYIIGGALQQIKCRAKNEADKKPSWLASVISELTLWVICIHSDEWVLHRCDNVFKTVMLHRSSADEGHETDLLYPVASDSVSSSDQVSARTMTSELHMYLGPQTIEQYGAALSTAYPVPYCCNNPSCVNLAHDSEVLLIKCKGSVCSGCHKARYCSKTCQKQHWKQHKPVCLRLRSEVAAE